MLLSKMPKQGDLFLDRYEIIALIGQGAMGCVYRAVHLALGTTFAIKVLMPQHSLQKDYQYRFLREAKINAQLRHQHAVQVYDVGQWNGWLYIVMEHLQGMPLREHMLDGYPLDMPMAMTVATQLASVLVSAHEIGLVHRDLKPENILVEYDDHQHQRIVVVDFGLAFINNTEDMSRLTQDRGTVSGTPAYMSPEQAMGGELSPASDIYAFGCILYELITGSPPFEAPSVMELLTRHMFVPPTPPHTRNPQTKASPALEQLVMRMLSKDPAQRPSAEQVQSRLADILAMPDHQGRGRQAMAHLSRAERMIEGATLKVEPDAQIEHLETMDWRSEHELELTAVKTLQDAKKLGFYMATTPPDELVIALASNELISLHTPTIESCQGLDLIVAPLLDPGHVPALAKLAPLIVPIPIGDIERVRALAQAGADEVIAWPIDAVELAKKAKRQLRKSKRKKEPQA